MKRKPRASPSGRRYSASTSVAGGCMAGRVVWGASDAVKLRGSLTFRPCGLFWWRLRMWHAASKLRAAMGRVFVTGMGVVSSLGFGKQRYWEALVEGRSGISEVTLFDTTNLPRNLGGEVKGFV